MLFKMPLLLRQGFYNNTNDNNTMHYIISYNIFIRELIHICKLNETILAY